MTPGEYKRLVARQAKERQGQQAIVDFLNLALPAGCVARAIPGGDGKVTTAPGYVSGTADMLVLIPSGFAAWTPIWFETKRLVGGRASPAQLAEQKYWRGRGVTWEFVRTIDDVVAHLKAHGIQLRVTAA